MTELFHKELPEFILDATHPYATEVTKNIKSAALASGISYIRVLRAESQSQNAVYVETAEQAVEYLRDREGRIFLTTGSKELAAFTTLPDYRERIYARVLSLPSVVEACQKLGFEGKHLIAMQGPFSKEMNEATLRQYECQSLRTISSAGNHARHMIAVSIHGLHLIMKIHKATAFCQARHSIIQCTVYILPHAHIRF